jgi:sulfide dehydrogenase cytochrome subunit
MAQEKHETHRFRAMLFLMTAGCLLLPGAAAADMVKLTESCQVCHGPDGVSRWPDIPNISGLPEIVIANALYDFRGRARPCRKAACGPAGTCPDVEMCELSTGLSDEEIDLYARYYASQAFSPSVAEIDPALASAGEALHEQYCERCHTSGGSDPLDEASILRGQNREYLRNAMEDFRARRRVDEAPMTSAFEKIDDAGLEALLHYYATPTH